MKGRKSILNMKGALLSFIFVFSISLCEGQSWLWAKEAHANFEGGDINNGDHCVATDKFGNVFYTGMFLDTISFDNYMIYSVNYASDMFTVKYNHFGKALWVRQGNAVINNYYPHSISVGADGVGSIYVTGYFGGKLAFGPDTLLGPINGYQELFLVKYDSAGNLMWAKQSNGTSVTTIVPTSMITDLNGNCYITGWFQDSVHFGSYALGTSGTSIFLAKFDVNGNVKWAKQAIHAPAIGTGGATSIAFGKDGKIYITGGFAGVVDFDTDTLKCNTSGGEFFIAKYDTLGNAIWASTCKSPSNASSSTASSIAVDGAGMIYVTGGFVDTLIFNADTLTSSQSKNDYSIFLFKFDSNANFKWAVQSSELTPKNYYASFSIVCDTLKRGGCYMGIYSTGFASTYFSVGFPGDTTTLTSKFGSGEIVLKFDSAGKAMCSSIFSEGIEDEGDGLCVDLSGKYVYFLGDLADTCVFGNDTLPCNRTKAELPFLACWQPCYPDTETTGTNKSKVQNRELKVFPNPSTGRFTLAFSGSPNVVSGTVEIYNVLGEKVLTQILRSALPARTGTGGDDKVIDLTNQPNGVYFYRVINNEGSVLGSGKVVIEK